jgi:thermitase
MMEPIMHKPLVIAILGALVLGLGIFQSSIYAVANAQEETERRQLPEGPYVPGNLIVKFRPDIRAEEADIMRSAMGATVVRRFPLIGAELWQMDDRVAEQALRQYGGGRRFEYVEPDYIIKLEQAPNDPDLPHMWGLNNTGQTGGTLDADIDAPEAWDINTGSSSVVIAVVDTGVQVATTQALALGCLENVPAHPDLAANLWVNPGEIPGDGLDNDSNGLVDDIHGWNFFDDAAGLFCTDSEDYHGTHVAGIIAARGNNSMGVTGVNWQAQIMVLKFVGPFGGPTSAAISAIEYATNKGAKVINASWGGPQDQESQALKAAIEACNCLFVAAAGNGGSDGIGDDNDQIPDHPSGFDSANIIAVASTDHNDNLAPFSNFGVTSVDLCAPGTSILSTLPTSDYGS